MADRLHLRQGLLYQHSQPIDFSEFDLIAAADQHDDQPRSRLRHALRDGQALVQRHPVVAVIVPVFLAAASSLAV
jgi:hypothetical protein